MHSNSPLISILMPCYNHEAYIQEAVESIWKQPNAENIEIIAIDDGSKDATYEKLQNLQKNSPIPMQIKTKENEGITKTLNHALSLASGKYVSVLASDDFYFNNAFEPLLNIFKKNKNIKVVYGNGNYFYGDYYGEAVHQTWTQDLLKKPPVEILKTIQTQVPRPLLTQCTLFDITMLKEIGGWDEEMKLDDWPLNIKIFDYLVKHNYLHSFIDRPVVAYRSHEMQIHKQSQKNFDMTIDVIHKYTPEQYKNKFLSSEYIFYAKNLAHSNNLKEANFYLKKAYKATKNIQNIYRVVRLYLKFNFTIFR